jgi:Pyruvate/2-oxoglutarate dehydrogenase complex, dihydrolipoamide acyltransferase (E2) component, and related enzymes
MSDKEITEDGKVIEKVLPVSGARKVILKHMNESLARSPQVTGTVKADVTKVVGLRTRLKEEGVKYTYTEIFAKLVTEAIKQEPIMNCSRVDNKIYVYSSINMGIAVTNKADIVMVPVIKNIQDKTLPEIAAEIRRLSAKVIDNTITMEDMSGGTITLSSMGMYNVDTFTPILNIPQGALIGFAKIRKEPVVDESGSIVVRDMLYLCVTADHAIIDGVPHARFMTKFVNILQDPEKYIGVLR